MKFSSISALVSTASLMAGVVGVPYPILEPRQGCTIKLQLVCNWNEAGLHRYRFHPSTSTNADLQFVLDNYWYTDYFFSCGAIQNNRQVFNHPVYGWVIDVSEAVGNNVIGCVVDAFMLKWYDQSGCAIAQGSFGSGSDAEFNKDVEDTWNKCTNSDSK